MFGMGFSEIFMIAVVAILALGPDKLPKAMYELAKYFKVLKKSINDAKSSFEQEIRIAELKEDAQKYKSAITKTKEGVRKKLTFEELEEIKSGVASTKKIADDNINDIKKDINSMKESAKNETKSKQDTKHKEVREKDNV